MHRRVLLYIWHLRHHLRGPFRGYAAELMYVLLTLPQALASCSSLTWLELDDRSPSSLDGLLVRHLEEEPDALYIYKLSARGHHDGPA
jgi:hypothetical protein